MRSYARFQLPYGYKKRITSALANYRNAHGLPPWETTDKEWGQELLSDLADEPTWRAMRSLLLARVTDVTGHQFKPDEFSVVLHWGRGEVPYHRDRMARTCFLIPIHCSPTLTFEVEGYRPLRLHSARLVRFNDHEGHGLHNPHWARFLIVSLTRDLL